MCPSRSQGVAISIISVQPLLHPLQTPVDRSRQQAGLRLCRAAGEKRCSCAKKCLLGNGRGHTLSSAACLGASRSATAASKQVATASGWQWPAAQHQPWPPSGQTAAGRQTAWPLQAVQHADSRSMLPGALLKACVRHRTQLAPHHAPVAGGLQPCLA